MKISRTPFALVQARGVGTSTKGQLNHLRAPRRYAATASAKIEVSPQPESMTYTAATIPVIKSYRLRNGVSNVTDSGLSSHHSHTTLSEVQKGKQALRPDIDGLLIDEDSKQTNLTSPESFEGQANVFESGVEGDAGLVNDVLEGHAEPQINALKDPSSEVPSDKSSKDKSGSERSKESRTGLADKWPVKPYKPPLPLTDEPLQPHHKPLISRYDWRLSSSLTPRRRNLMTPPDMFHNAESSAALLGNNKLIGVGLDPVGEAGRDSETLAESWLTRLRKQKASNHKKGEEGAESDDSYRESLDRLVELQSIAEEAEYLRGLAALGRPQAREAKGRAICEATGRWIHKKALSDPPESKQKPHTTRTARQKRWAAADWEEKVLCVWEKMNGEPFGPIIEQKGLFAPGSTVRFTPVSAADFKSKDDRPDVALRNCPQGKVVHLYDKSMVVSIPKEDMWDIGDVAYTIDVGMETSGVLLKTRAIAALYNDLVAQTEGNEEVIRKAQKEEIAGTTQKIHECVLHGTALRHLIVPRKTKKLHNSDNSHHGEDGWSQEKERLKMLVERFESSDPEKIDGEIQNETTQSTPAADEELVRPDIALHPSDLLSENQLINSWIRRHRRKNPMSMTGDPVLNLNESQIHAVAMAFGEKLSLIQGPPGTGKSQTIVSAIKLLKGHFRIPQPILLAAPTHVSIDHLLALLIRAGLNPIRAGHASRVRPDLQEWTIESRERQHPLWEEVEHLREAVNRLALQVLEEEAVDLQASGIDVTGSSSDIQPSKKTLNLRHWLQQTTTKMRLVENRLYASMMSYADVVCSTAMGSGSSRALQLLDLPIVFLDEAAMCTEPDTLIPLMKGSSHVTLIGDHKQLPAVVTSRQVQRERLHVSLFERLIKGHTVKSTLLDTQYRMRPIISAFPNISFYASALQDSKTLAERPPQPKSKYFVTAPTDGLNAIPDPTVFISHTGEERLSQRSFVNTSETAIIMDVVSDLLLQNPDLRGSDIGIISPYMSQTRLLQSVFNEYAIPILRPVLFERTLQITDVEVNTVDGFQGREKRVIILSTVRSNNSGYIGFLTDKRRLNVALTRAQDALFVIGNVKTLKASTRPMNLAQDPNQDYNMWPRYLEWLERRGLVREWSSKPKVSTAPPVELVREDRVPDDPEAMNHLSVSQ